LRVAYRLAIIWIFRVGVMDLGHLFSA
jgi:hypothetical protein